MKDLTLKQMASELNEFFKANNHDCQYTISGRTVIYIDYSIVKNRKEYGNAPVFAEKQSRYDLHSQYNLLKKGLLR